jgi:hypothetical protein
MGKMPILRGTGVPPACVMTRAEATSGLLPQRNTLRGQDAHTTWHGRPARVTRAEATSELPPQRGACSVESTISYDQKRDPPGLTRRVPRCERAVT